MKLHQFNQLSAAEAHAAIAHCVAIPDWRNALVAGRPFASQQALMQYARQLASDWNERDLAQALTAHPRIGERPQGEGKEAALSRQEQSSVSDNDRPLKQALQIANADYERRFGRVFLIRAKGRSGEEILAQLLRRLENDRAQEQQEAINQLREITLLRLQESVI